MSGFLDAANLLFAVIGAGFCVGLFLATIIFCVRVALYGFDR